MTAIRSADTEEARSAAARLAEARSLLTDPGKGEFFDALFASALSEEVLSVRPVRLVALAEALHEEVARHQKGGIDVVLLDDDETRETVLVGINDDRPFLFDSALQAALAHGARIRAAFHPIITVKGQRTSVIALICNTIASESERMALVDGLREAFTDGAAAVRDWRAMLARLDEARAELAASPPAGDISESLAFLDWLAADHFTFLGARDYVLSADDDHGRLEPVEGSGLGVLSPAAARVIRSGVERQGLSAPVRAYLDEPESLIVTKSHARSKVHRRGHMDYIGIKRFDARGNFAGEHRFVGLFTSSAYSAQPRTVPLLRQKIAAVMTRAGLDPASHDGKALTHILDTFPRDELFQVSVDELYEIATGILRLGGLPRLKLFLRFDRFDRFVSVILLAPRDHLNSRLVADIHAYLANMLNGRTSAADMAADESPLARIHYIIGRNEGPIAPIDMHAMEQHIAGMIETWDDALATAMCAIHGNVEGPRRLEALGPRFSPGYRDHFAAHEGARDLWVLQELAAARDGLKIRASVWRKPDDASAALRLKLHVLGDVLPLSASLPVFENLGLKVISEDAFPVSFYSDGGWRQEAVILDFAMERADGVAVNLDEVRQPLEDAFHAVLRDDAESDGFNRLVVGAGLSWRDVTVLRAVGRYLRQAAIPFSLAYMEQALVKNPDVATLLVALFYARCAPEAGGDATAVRDRIEAALRDVPSLDEDRILRRFRNVIENVLRTNFWQKDENGDPRPYIAIKLESARLDELPAPRPWREIFVYSPAMEGVHLRFGPIARGGIRWSDRREDFRTEILGLVKAQQVKNAVIVPVGAKGGFFPKTMPAVPSREEFMAAGIAAYKTLINALLDVTDNLDGYGAIVPPPDVLRPDGDDPYLVVAADKGTATFSDIANAIALERGFWLGDAFASGGSVGYDHKKMGITARGAWEAVKRHFREMGTDIQKEDFTVIGVGDMSGDVFGNGMLLSEHIRLIAAFDHRHVFLDPNADAAAGFAERRRLFELPRSSWDDYNRERIGKGGGVFARSLKEIPLTPEVKAMLEVDADALSPPALINALLKARTDLLWFGGIGTYVKAASQSNADAGDRANDPVRVNGSEVRARVVGEGANLGVTQPGRIEYARGGGRIDTDAVDNSAGVDTSDHEVNLKILLSGPVRRGEIDETERNRLLASMTDAVAAHVLADNYNQTLALSVAELTAAQDVDADARFMRDLESRGRLDRAVEFLPGDAAMMTLAHDRRGLTRPELCVLLAYAKLDLDAQVLASPLPDDPALEDLASGYFPPEAIAAFPAEPPRHRLKREIVSTVLVNRIVNLAGPVFAFRMRELSGLSGAEVARGFVMADGAFGLSALKERIDMLDGKIPAEIQIRLYAAIADHLRRVTPWFLTHVAADAALTESIALYRAGTEALRAGAVLDEDVTGRLAEWCKDGVPEEIAHDVALLPALAAAPDIALLAHDAHRAPAQVAALYFALGRTLGLDRLRGWGQRLSPSEHWDRLALRRLTEDLSATQRALARRLLADGSGGIDAWAARNAAALERIHGFAAAMESSGELSIAKLMLAASQVRNLA
ncbi:MAG: NAD-glutamate dehydrogenase [Alphaproteobacteria bacterium]|nr:NAD-glutamate dehydrogenase [Alphaproteobacteria bacterium]